MYTEAEYRLLDKFKQLKKLQQRQKQPTPNTPIQLQKPPALQIPSRADTKSRLNGVGRSPLDSKVVGKEDTKTLDATERAKALLRGRGRGGGSGTAPGSFKRPSVKRMAPGAPASEDEHSAVQYNKSQFSHPEKHRMKMPKLESSIINGQSTLFLTGLPPDCSEMALSLAFEQHGFEPDRFQILEGGPNTVIFYNSKEADRLLHYLSSGKKQITVKGQKILVSQNPQEILHGETKNALGQGQGQGQGQTRGQVTQQNQTQKPATFKRPLRKQIVSQNKEIVRQKSQGEIQQLTQQTRESYISEGQNSVRVDDGRGVVTYEDI